MVWRQSRRSRRPPQPHSLAGASDVSHFRAAHPRPPRYFQIGQSSAPAAPIPHRPGRSRCPHQIRTDRRRSGQAATGTSHARARPGRPHRTGGVQRGGGPARGGCRAVRPGPLGAPSTSSGNSRRQAGRARQAPAPFRLLAGHADGPPTRRRRRAAGRHLPCRTGAPAELADSAGPSAPAGLAVPGLGCAPLGWPHHARGAGCAAGLSRVAGGARWVRLGWLGSVGPLGSMGPPGWVRPLGSLPRQAWCASCGWLARGPFERCAGEA